MAYISVSATAGNTIPAADINQLQTNIQHVKDNTLALDNTATYTPDADYQPATKKYVDDNSGGSPTEFYLEQLGTNTALSTGTPTSLLSKTITKDGKYLVTGTITFYNTANDDRNLQLFIFKNSTKVGRATTSLSFISSPATYAFATVTIYLDLVNTDVVSLQGQASMANNLAGAGSPSQTSLTIVELAS